MSSSTIRLTIPGTTEAHTLVPTIVYTQIAPEEIGFADDEQHITGMRTHVFEVVVRRDRLWWDDGAWIEATDDEWAALAMLAGESHPDRAASGIDGPAGVPVVFTPERLLVARVQIDEFAPVAVATASVDWTQYVNPDGGEHAWLTHLLARPDVRPTRHYTRRASARVLFIRTLETHPAMTGQGLARRLLTHAMARLEQAETDLVALEAYPLKTIFAPALPHLTVSGVARLVGFYEHVGFVRAFPEQPLELGASVPMVLARPTHAQLRVA
jgi:GNAT superfamily N-acetyltransferase